MKFFTLPDTVPKLLVALALSALVLPFQYPSDAYSLWQDAMRDTQEEFAVLKIEEEFTAGLEKRPYAAGTSPPEINELEIMKRDLRIRRARLEVAQKRVADLRSRWEKSNRWAIVGGVMALVWGIFGGYKWFAADTKGSI